MIRRYSFISSYEFLQLGLTAVGLFTSLYAGLSSLIEPDLKKVVALSTLRHLGFICLGLGLGCPLLAFIHLLAHAFFKSSLFVRLGALISQYSHYQDSRFFSRIAVFNPFFGAVILVSCANLMGLPFLSGFYSKDLILEVCSYSSVGVVLCRVMYINLIFTYSYSFRVLLALSSPRFMGSYRNTNSSTSHLFTCLLGMLRLVSIPFVGLRVKSFNFIFLCSTMEIKFIPLLILVIISIVNILYLNSFQHTFYSPLNLQSVFLYRMVNLSLI
jgi:NADH-ubiquinone oxidoreductase chain 5